MKNDRFKAKLAALEALRANLDPQTGVPALRKALADRSNFIVAKAATIAGGAGLAELTPDVLGAFDRLLAVVADDPGCRAKNALAKALKELDHHDPAPFMRGLAHIQPEPVWGGTADTAGALRATCAQALVACNVDTAVLLAALTDHFVDADKAVRVEIAIAIAHLGRPESALLLRLKALCGDREPEVVGQCLISLLDLVPDEAVEFVARFLSNADADLRFEAVNALALAKSARAFGEIERFWNGDPSFELRRATVAALAGSPHPKAAEFLLNVLERHALDLGESALVALGSSRFRTDVRARVAASVARIGNARLQDTFDRSFGDP